MLFFTDFIWMPPNGWHDQPAPDIVELSALRADFSDRIYGIYGIFVDPVDPVKKWKFLYYEPNYTMTPSKCKKAAIQ